MPRARLIDALAMPSYDLGADHPFAADRQRPLYDLLERQGLVDGEELIGSEPASRAELEFAHEPDYIDLLCALAATPRDPELCRRATAFGMGTADNPLTPDQHQGASAAAGATLTCVRQVLDGGASAAFNPTGGLHHAQPAAASGFCIYNDLVIGIREALARGAERVAYLDFDVHHGDGVEHAFAEDPRVLTISFHEDPAVRWPGTGYVQDRGRGAGLGSVINMPFVSGTGDSSWQHCVEQILRHALASFRPDFLLTQHGCDTHYEDPLAELELTTGSCLFAATLCAELAAEHCAGRWVATGGGGYQPYRVLPRAWALVWAAMSGRPTPLEVDPGWLQAWQGRSHLPLPRHYLDERRSEPEELRRINAATLARLIAQIG